jgi:transposase
MTLLPQGVKVHLAFGYTDMRKGIDGLAMLVQSVLRQDPFSGHLFVFRGRKANHDPLRPFPLASPLPFPG